MSLMGDSRKHLEDKKQLFVFGVLLLVLIIPVQESFQGAGGGCGDGICVAGEDPNNCPIDCFPVCGNDVVEGSEACDGADLRGETCVSLGFNDGVLLCSVFCSFDTSSCFSEVCGNGVAEGSEQCDGADLRGNTCVSLGFPGGVLSCNESCSVDFSFCVPLSCGDGVCAADEDSISCPIDCVFDSDSDGVPDVDDACPNTFGVVEFQGCPVGDKNNVVLHLIDQVNKMNTKDPIDGAEVRVFDRKTKTLENYLIVSLQSCNSD